MHRRLNLPEVFLLISLAMIAVEAALAQWSLVKARYRLRDTLASLAMQAGNIAMNLGMAGIVYAGLKAAYDHRWFDLSPSSPWGSRVPFSSMIAAWTLTTGVPTAPAWLSWCSGRNNVAVGLISVCPNSR